MQNAVAIRSRFERDYCAGGVWQAERRPGRLQPRGNNAMAPRKAGRRPQGSGVPPAEHHAEESQIVLPALLAGGREFDFAFVDANHRFDWLLVDLFLLGRLLRPGTVIFLDDYQLPGVARAINFFVTNVGWSLEVVGDADPLHQWAALRTSSDPDDRPFSYFVDF